MKNINECLATEIIKKHDTEVILFIKTNDKIKIDDNFRNKVKKEIKNLLSPKHIPSFIIEVSDIPKTKSGKIVEMTIKKIINNEIIDNLNVLSNPECLDEYYEIAKRLNQG